MYTTSKGDLSMRICLFWMQRQCVCPSSRPAPSHPSTRYIHPSVLSCPMLLEVRAPVSMMSHSLCTHAVMLTVFNLASTSPRFHHPFCLLARPHPSNSSSGTSLSVSSSAPSASCSFFFRFTFPQRWLSPPAQILLAYSPLSLVALDSTLPNLCACESPVHILLVPLLPDFPTRKLSAPAPYPRTWLCPPLPALGKKGDAVTAGSPCSCTAESRDCRARSSLHVGDRYPIASRRSC